MTNTGSTKFEAAAVEGCAGGEESIAPELKKLKVRFGELISNKKTLSGLSEQEARSVVSNSKLQECS